MRTQRIKDLVEAGVVEAVGMLTRAIEVAFSAARAFLKTGAWHLQG